MVKLVESHDVLELIVKEDELYLLIELNDDKLGGIP